MDTQSPQKKSRILSDENLVASPLGLEGGNPAGSVDSGKQNPFPDSRLIIKCMELENFKSYAGKVTLGPFHKFFSAIVGPNGSGKSNSIDAMLFVFGKRAAKLRLKKVSELIHNSTAFPDLQYASVAVHFCNIVDRDFQGDDDEGYDVVPGSEMEVKRVAYRNNKSEYFVDGERKSFNDVSHILMSRGIDLKNNRFLILQGEVEQISLLKPKGTNDNEDGLLEYLEDIIGSNQYVEQIEKLSSDVDVLSDARNEKLNRVKVVEKDMESLEDAKNEAENFIKKETLLVQKRTWLVQNRMLEAEEEISEVKAKASELQKKLEEETRKSTAANSKKEEIANELQKISEEHAGLEESLSESKKLFAAFERKDIKYREDLKDLQQQIKDSRLLETKQTKLVSKHTAAATKLQDKTIPALENEHEELNADLKKHDTALQNLFESLSGESSSLRVKLESKQSGLGELSKKVSQCKTDLEMVRTEIDLVQMNSSSSKDALTNSRNKLEDLEIASTSRPKELAATKADLSQAEKDLENIVKNQKKAEESEVQLEGELRKACEKMANAKALRGSNSNRVALVSALLKAKQDSANPISSASLYGRLGDLGTIDSAYDVAVSTACGGGLDYLVTETAKGAETCVKYLRDKKLGRSTFAILEKLSHLTPRMQKVVKTPEGVPRLFDLISVKNEKMKLAFYHIMRDTLVAKDLDQAVRIAYEGNKAVWRVVTMDGQVIDTSGTMAGGGKRVQRGGMRLNGQDTTGSLEMPGEFQDGGAISAEGIKSLEADVSDLRAKVVQSRKRIATLKKEKIRLDRLINELKMMIPKITLEIDQMDEQRQILLDSIADMEKSVVVSKEDVAKLKKLKTEEKKKLQEYEKANKKLSELEAVTAELRTKVTDIGGPEAAKAKSKIAEIDAALDKNKKARAKAQADLKKFLTNSKKATDAQQEAQKERLQAEARLNDLQTEFKNLEDDALEVVQCLESVKSKEADKKKIMTELSSKLKKEENVCDKFTKIVLDMHHQLRQLNDHELPSRERSRNDLQNHIRDLREKYVILLKQRRGADSTDDIDIESTNKPEKGDISSSSELEPETSLLLDNDQLASLDFSLIRIEIDQLEAEIQKLKKVVNLGSIVEYQTRTVEYTARCTDLENATMERDKIRDQCDNLRKKRLDEFMAGFSQITLRLKEMYQMITLGGDAELELVDSCDPFSEGIVFSVRPPKKSWKNISNLSGGEKTLSSLALVFALHHYNPTPLYVLDEIDAALDFRNVSIVGKYIKERTKNAQFIIISLRNNMFELADRLVGIYKTNDATKTITINPEKVAKMMQHKQTQRSKDSDNDSKRAPLSTLSPNN